MLVFHDFIPCFLFFLRLSSFCKSPVVGTKHCNCSQGKQREKDTTRRSCVLAAEEEACGRLELVDGWRGALEWMVTVSALLEWTVRVSGRITWTVSVRGQLE